MPEADFTAEVSSLRLDNMKRVVSFLTDHASLFTEHCMAYIVSGLSDCVQLVKLPPQAFAHIVARYAQSSSVVMNEMLLRLSLVFPDDILVPSSGLWRHLLLASRHPSLCAESRALYLLWLRHSPTQLKQLSPKAMMTLLQPCVFDPPAVTTKQIANVCRFWLTLEPTGLGLLPYLTCYSDFFAYDPASGPVRALFRTLQNFYVLGYGTALAQQVYDNVVKLVLRLPKFMANAIDLGESLESHCLAAPMHEGRTFLHKILEELKKELINKPDSEFIAHLPEVMVA